MTRQSSDSAMTCKDVQEQTDAYLDRALPLAESKAVEAHLRTCANCRAEIEMAETVETQLRHALRNEAPPHRLWPRILADLRAGERGARHVERRMPSGRLARRAVIAAGALLVIGAVLAGRRAMTTAIDTAQLMQTPVDELRSFVDSGRPLDISTIDPTRLRAWFAPRVGFAPPAPPTASDLSLVGGRLCYFFQRRIAAYMYRADGHALSLYIISDRDIEPPSCSDAMLGDRPAAVREFNGFAHILWRERSFYYSLVSDQPAKRLFQAARAITSETG